MLVCIIGLLGYIIGTRKWVTHIHDRWQHKFKFISSLVCMQTISHKGMYHMVDSLHSTLLNMSHRNWVGLHLLPSRCNSDWLNVKQNHLLSVIEFKIAGMSLSSSFGWLLSWKTIYSISIKVEQRVKTSLHTCSNCYKLRTHVTVNGCCMD